MVVRVREHNGHMKKEVRALEMYEMVRNLPYRTDAAYDSVGLREQGRGNCVAKAALLAEEFLACGLVVRLVSWEYELPVLVEVQRSLRFSSDVHTAVEVHIEGEWVLVDATHDPPLADLGLTVGQWNGLTSTEPAYAPLGSIIPHDGHGSAARLGRLRSQIDQQVGATHPDIVNQYQRDLNGLFEQARR